MNGLGNKLFWFFFMIASLIQYVFNIHFSLTAFLLMRCRKTMEKDIFFDFFKQLQPVN